MHFWSSGNRTMCKLFVCGSPCVPSDLAVFTAAYVPDAPATPHCKLCFRARLKLPDPAYVETEVIDSGDDEDAVFESDSDEDGGDGDWQQ